MMENHDYSCWHFGGISSDFFFPNVTIFILSFFFLLFLFVRKMEITVCYVRQRK